MFIVGVYDDFYRADFKLKFLLQIIVAKILIDQGYVISNYYGLFGLYEVPWLLAQISTVFVFLVIVNAINFIDGIDGLAISEVIKTILIIEFLSLGYTKLSSMGFIVIFSLLPLYYFNFKRKSKVFLGDGGSLLLGSIIAIYIFYLLGEEFIFDSKWVLNKTLFSILVIIYPLSDLLRVFIIRAKNGVSPFKPDKNHIHHLLNSKTKSHIIATSVIIFVQLLIFFTYYSFD
jgi:UDP-N-acetylmuramyl pentapeptide phosphotransferase/UDP-N-acetylglucosamine-1-phosphate transferase